MRRNVLLVAAVAATLTFTLLARTETASQPGGPATGSTPGQRSAAPVDPDSFFTPTRLKPHQRPPQFIVVSFDGAGSHQKWQFWRRVAGEAHMRFTGFLSGIYLVGAEHRTAYTGPGHAPGRASIRFFRTAEVRQLVTDLNLGWRDGDEIGTHYNGHFCAGAGYSGGQWTTADWTAELHQFFRFFREYKQINADPTMPTLQVPADTVKGGRTPCLEDRPGQLMPALRKLGLSYDSSGSQNGVAWPKKNGHGIWELPMSYVPMPGRPGGVISMDFNFWVKQTGNPPRAGRSVADARQALATYQRMLASTYHSNRAPLVLGNHFNSWNNDAYTEALATFVRHACRLPDTHCVPYRDVIRWMQAQDPAVLARLQALPAVDTVRPGTG
jgi:hypothetical protein